MVKVQKPICAFFVAQYIPGRGSPVSELTMERNQSESERGKRGREGIRGGGTRKREGEENSVPQYNCITSVL